MWFYLTFNVLRVRFNRNGAFIKITNNNISLRHFIILQWKRGETKTLNPMRLVALWTSSLRSALMETHLKVAFY